MHLARVSNAFCRRLQGVLLQIARREHGFWLAFWACCRCEKFAIFRKIERQKHSSLQKNGDLKRVTISEIASFSCVFNRFYMVIFSRMVRQENAFCKIDLPFYTLKPILWERLKKSIIFAS